VKVLIYVEAPSDKAGMQELLLPLIDEKRKRGIAIEFFETPEGDRKASVLTKVPVKAVNILKNTPECIVVAMPDLYPRNKVFPHSTIQELQARYLQIL
jgi:hypothetical protein